MLSGQPVKLGASNTATMGVALVDIAVGNSGAVQICGVFNVPKVTNAVIKIGESLLWDASAGKFDDNQATAAAGDVLGSVIATADGKNGETMIDVRFSGTAGVLS